MSINYREKIVTLWIAFLLGVLFHTQLGLMPLFYGQSVVIANADPSADISLTLWSMLGFFALPIIAAVVTAFNDSKRYRIAHFWLTIFYTIINLLHVVLDLLVAPIVWSQIALMVILFFIGLLLNRVAFQWMTSNHQEKVIKLAK